MDQAEIALRTELLEKLKGGSDILVVYLTNGIKLTGSVIAYDNYSVQIADRVGAEGTVVHHHAIASMRRALPDEGGRTKKM